MAVPLAEYKPALLADIILDGGTQRVASKDFYDASGNYYKGSLVEIPGIQKALSDLYYGVEETSSVILKIANAESNVDDTWDEIIVTGADEARGREVLIQRNDPIDGTSFELRGKIIEYRLGPTVEITVETRRDYALDTLLPQAIVTNDAPWTATAIDIGKAVNLCFGRCRNVPLRNILNDRGNDLYDYLIGYGTIEDLWVDHANGLGVKRDGVLVNTAEYGTNAPDYDNGAVFDGSQANPYNGYAFIRFTREQMSFTGAFHNITADVKGLEIGGATAERNFANVIKNILSNTTWGLSESVDAASFATAAAALPTALYMCDGAITEQRKSRDVLNDLLFPSRATLTRAADGEWEMDVDVAGASILNLGDNDGYYNNVKVVNASAMNAEEALANITIHYSIDSANPDLPFKEITHSTGLSFGIDKTYNLSFVLENVTAQKVASYLTRRCKYSDETVLLQGGMECRDLLCGNIVTLTAPARDISAKEYMIERISKGIASFELSCREYNSAIYGDEAIGDPTGQTSSDATVQGPKVIIGQTTLGDGSDHPGIIVLQVAPGKGDTYIGAGKTDFTTADNGFILGIDDSDADKVKFYLGDATDYIYWNGVNLVLSGNVTAAAGNIGGFYIGANDLWGGNAAIGNAATTIVLGNLDGTSKIALGASADAITFAGNETGFIVDGGGNLRVGDASSWLKYSSAGEVEVKALVEVIGDPALQNMLMNGGFEETDGTNAYYWEAEAGITTEVAGGDDSNKYLKVVRVGAANHYAVYSNPDNSIRYFEVNEGEVYELGGSLKSDGTCTAGLFVEGYDKDKGYVSMSTTSTAAVVWTTKLTTYTVPAGVKFLDVAIGAINVNGWAAFDNIYLKRVDEKAWSFTHASDRTKIDGGNIYTNTITASEINGAGFGTLTITSGKIAINTTDALEIQAAGNVKVLAGGDIYLIGSNANPGKVYFKGTSYEVSMGCNTAGSVFQIGPDTDSVVSCQIGYGDVWTNNFSTITLRADTIVRCYAYKDATQAARIDVYADHPRAMFILEWNNVVHDIVMSYDNSGFRFYPDNNIVDFGLTGMRWKTGWFVDLTVTNCITEGTCEIVPGDALAAIRDIVQPGSGIFNEFDHERFDMKRLQPKYPFLFVYDEETDEYREKIGTKSDLLYTAVMQLDQRVKNLEEAKPL